MLSDKAVPRVTLQERVRSSILWLSFLSCCGAKRGLCAGDIHNVKFKIPSLVSLISVEFIRSHCVHSDLEMNLTGHWQHLAKKRKECLFHVAKLIADGWDKNEWKIEWLIVWTVRRITYDKESIVTKSSYKSEVGLSISEQQLTYYWGYALKAVCTSYAFRLFFA